LIEPERPPRTIKEPPMPSKKVLGLLAGVVAILAIGAMPILAAQQTPPWQSTAKRHSSRQLTRSKKLTQSAKTRTRALHAKRKTARPRALHARTAHATRLTASHTRSLAAVRTATPKRLVSAAHARRLTTASRTKRLISSARSKPVATAAAARTKRLAARHHVSRTLAASHARRPLIRKTVARKPASLDKAASTRQNN
jgi:hypothetical protein